MAEVDTTTIGQLAVQMMDDIQAEYGEGAEIVDAMLIVEIEMPDSTTTQWRSTTDRNTTNVGMARLALVGLEHGQFIESEDDE